MFLKVSKIYPENIFKISLFLVDISPLRKRWDLFSKTVCFRSAQVRCSKCCLWKSTRDLRYLLQAICTPLHMIFRRPTLIARYQRNLFLFHLNIACSLMYYVLYFYVLYTMLYWHDRWGKPARTKFIDNKPKKSDF